MYEAKAHLPLQYIFGVLTGPVLAQIILTLGIVVAQAINLGTQHIAGFGWRISLACAGIPALVLTAGGLLLPDTPNSLIDRGREEEGKQVGLPGTQSG